MRCFLALDVNDQVRRFASKLQAVLQEQDVRGKRTQPDIHHLTLQFLGDVPEQIPERFCVRVRDVAFCWKQS